MKVNYILPRLKWFFTLNFKITCSTIILTALCINNGVTNDKAVIINNKKEFSNLEKIKNFLEKLTTLTAKFIQEDFNDTSASVVSGVLFLDKSNGLRIDYDNFIYPSVITDKERLILFNHYDKTTDTYALSDTPAFFITQKKLDFKKDIEIVSYAEKQDTALITLRKTPDYSGALITLYFSLKPFILLKGWMVEVDSKKTVVNFIEGSIKIGGTIDKKLFVLPSQE